MIPALALAVFFWAALLVSLRRFPALHPLQLWAAPWALTSTLFAMHLLPYRWLDLGTAALVTVATAAFAAGVLLAEPLYRRFRRLRGARNGAGMDSTSLAIAAAAALAVTSAGAIVFIIDLSRTVGLEAALSSNGAARRAVVEGAAANTLGYLYLAYAAAPLCALAAARAGGRGLLAWGGATAVAVGSTYFSTGRTFVLFAFAAALVAFWLGADRQLRPARLMAAAAACAALVLTGFVVVANIQDRTIREAVSATSPNSVPSVFREHEALSQLGSPYQYLSAPLPALDVLIDKSPTLSGSGGCASARIACVGLDAIGVGVEPRDPAMPYTAPPLAWNTFTALDLPLRDGGRLGMIAILWITGLGVGLAWSAISRRTLIGSIAYPMMSGPLLLASWQYAFTGQYLIGAILIAVALVKGAGFASRTILRQGGVAPSRP